jgi:predicted ArsR family transcriptional regulator
MVEPVNRIYADDLAKIMKKTSRTARRMLEELETKHGEQAVRYEGRERYTWWDALEQFTHLRRDQAQSFNVAKLITTIRRLLSNVGEHDKLLVELESRIQDIEVRLPRLCLKIS